MTGVNQIRKTFLDFFAREGHAVVESSPLVPRNDPTLMFTSAGMVQFKQLFTGVEKRAYSTAATAQKCLRAGGKHNDLDNVGYTARHHTFFEMLGNFSFGDYFKDRAIDLAWRMITREYGLPKDKLIVTVYHTDEEARALWRKIAGLPDERIVSIATSDNFWSAGDTGPCGPCSEIFYDHGPHIAGGPPGSPEADGDRFIEIWNLVFMQFDQLAGGERVPLPRPSIDTGMGLERISAVLQGTHDNYETDLMRALVQAAAQAVGVEPDGARKASCRVMADHLRASAFLIADGVLPSNEGRGYVLRRIMRRAMRHAHLLGAREPAMHRLVPALVREMGQPYPELVRAEALVSETLRLEEIRFRRTLERGLAILDEESRGLSAGAVFSGETAFTLYDTFGFPLDLTEDALRPRGVTVDGEAFKAAMARQKEMARAAWAGSGEAATDAIWYGLRERLGATDFLGYDLEEAEGEVLAIVSGGVEKASLSAGETGLLVLNQTPFYGESGGQVGDRGLMTGDGARLLVTDTQKKLGDLFVHAVTVEAGAVSVGQGLALAVDRSRRAAIRANHSATHLLHEALRLTLGDHIAQKGSLVGPDRLRFDFSHPKPVGEDELARIEDLANAEILGNTPVVTRLMGVEDAKASGARALFGEKYGEEVRVVSMGRAPAGANISGWSVELCGGTHVARTGDIGLVAVVAEGAVAAGVRRLEALTGEAARHHLSARSRKLEALAGLVRSPLGELETRLAALMDDRRRLERELAEARKAIAMGSGGSGGGEAIKTIGSVKVIAKSVTGVEMKDLKSLADAGKRQLGSGVVAIVGLAPDGKAGLVVGVTEDLAGKLNAVDLVRLGSEALGGKGGGGRPDLAQAGGPDGARAAEALAAIERALAAA